MRMIIKKTVLILTLLITVILSSAQSNAKKMDMTGKHVHWTVDFGDSQGELQVTKLDQQQVAPEPVMRSAKIKADLDRRRRMEQNVAYKTSPYTQQSEDITPEITTDFNGKPVGSAGIPNDNTLAVSNDGIIISAINTTVTILDSDGNMLKFRTLAGIVAGQLGILDRFYDPKVLYDPVADRFILVFLEGSESSDTRIIVGFTETNDPTGLWNFYQLDGNPFGGNNWSDYPIIAHNGEDLYITVNSLLDNTSWQEGFLQSYIWQINKEDGYAGNALRQNLFYDINYKNAPVWSICPVQPATDFEAKDMYFLSVRPDAESNDTVFLHYIDNGSVSGDGMHSLRVLSSDTKYGVPPSAVQPGVGILLQTNDTRVLSATLLGNQIHYTQSCIVEDPLSSGVYHGVIKNLNSADESVEAQIISTDGMDYAYPSISYTGSGMQDERSMLITFSQVGKHEYPGTAVIFSNSLDDFGILYSPVIEVKKGDSTINTVLADSIERWGDYTDVQREYDEEGVVWICGSYGDENLRNNVWIAKINVSNDLQVVERVIVFPNPAASSAIVDFVSEGSKVVDIILTDSKGDIILRLDDQLVADGQTQFLIDLTGLLTGIYYVSIINEEKEVLHSQKIIVSQ